MPRSSDRPDRQHLIDFSLVLRRVNDAITFHPEREIEVAERREIRKLFQKLLEGTITGVRDGRTAHLEKIAYDKLPHARSLVDTIAFATDVRRAVQCLHGMQRAHEMGDAARWQKKNEVFIKATRTLDIAPVDITEAFGYPPAILDPLTEQPPSTEEYHPHGEPMRQAA